MKYEFYIDRKITTWERDHYEVEAESKEVAVEIMKEEFFSQDYEDKIFKETETLYDTSEEMTVEENQGHATKELYFKNQMIMNNGTVFSGFVDGMP